MPKNEFAWIYLLEDINDNRYIGSTGETNLTDRLSTHRRDEKEQITGKRCRNCSSMKLNLYNCIIIPLMICSNDKETRKKWESHFINNVYPDCVNEKRLNFDRNEWARNYYHNNKEKRIKYSKDWREKNKEKVNAKRREYYAKNKDKLLQQAKISRKKKLQSSL